MNKHYQAEMTGTGNVSFVEEMASTKICARKAKAVFMEMEP